MRDFDGSEGESIQINTFWERNFEQEDDVPWYKFQQAFLSDYEAQLSGEWGSGVVTASIVIVNIIYKEWGSLRSPTPCLCMDFICVSTAWKVTAGPTL